MLESTRYQLMKIIARRLSKARLPASSASDSLDDSLCTQQPVTSLTDVILISLSNCKLHPVA